MLSHEKLDVYQRSIEFLAAALGIAGDLPRGQAPLADQLRRAAMSNPLNIAEGTGRMPNSADRARFAGSHAGRPWSVAQSWMSLGYWKLRPTRTGVRPRHSSCES